MPDRDPAFLWETEALRASSPPAGPASRSNQAGSDGRRGGAWVTLRQAHETTGIPIGTLRSWARRETVPSYVERTPSGSRRMVSLQAVRLHAAEQGRHLARGEPGRAPEAEAGPAETGPPGDERTSPTPGTMIVPIEAWDRMLIQLGNLHQAGQQLAEARERAARAETEATFLRERLGELRSRLGETPPAPSPVAEAGSGPGPEITDTGEEESPPGRLSMAFWRMMARRLIRD